MDNIANSFSPLQNTITSTQAETMKKVGEYNEKKSTVKETLEAVSGPFLEEGLTRGLGIGGNVAKRLVKDKYGIDIQKYENMINAYTGGGKEGLRKQMLNEVVEKSNGIGEKFNALGEDAKERVANAYENTKSDGNDLKSLFENAQKRKDLVDNELQKSKISRPVEKVDLPQEPKQDESIEQQTEGDKIRNMSNEDFVNNEGSDGLRNRFNTELNNEQQQAFREQFVPQEGQQITQERVAEGHDIIDNIKNEEPPEQNFIGNVVGDEDEGRRIGQDPQGDAELGDVAPVEAPVEADVGEKVADVGEKVVSKATSFGGDVEKALATATEGSEVLDESPIGAVLTAGLGIATLFTGLFGVHKHDEESPQPVNPSFQIGV